MKLEKYVDKNIKKRKVILTSISIIVLVSLSFLLYKTFASFTESVEFPMMKGQVDYFGNSDIYFAFYNGKEQMNEMPSKDNIDNLVFDYAECDNGADIIWDSEAWSPLIKNLSKSKTKCSIYFKEKTSINICNKYGNDSALCYISKLGDNDYVNMAYDHASANGVLDNNLRYIGADPNNYIRFNNEKWRIIGIMKVKTTNGVMEERLKIVRQDEIEGQKDFGNFCFDGTLEKDNNWINSTLKKTLNDLYYNSSSGECYQEYNKLGQCDFTENGSELPKGLDAVSQNMIDKDVIWNLGEFFSPVIKTPEFYERERATVNTFNIPVEWSKNNDNNNFNGIGLIYVSDYGYAVGSNARVDCLKKVLNGTDDYRQGNCGTNDWLKPKSGSIYQITPSAHESYVMPILSTGVVGFDGYDVIIRRRIWPTIYLKPNIKIENDENDDYGTVNNPMRIFE